MFLLHETVWVVEDISYDEPSNSGSEVLRLPVAIMAGSQQKNRHFLTMELKQDMADSSR